MLVYLTSMILFIVITIIVALWLAQLGSDPYERMTRDEAAWDSRIHLR